MSTILASTDIPPLVADAIRRIRYKHPEFKPYLRKRMASFLGCSPSLTDKWVNGQQKTLDSAALLNMDQFFNGLLLMELRGEELSDSARADLMDMAKRIERIAGKWTLGA